MLPNILTRTNECIFTLCTLPHQYFILSYLIWLLRHGPELFITWTHRGRRALLSPAFSSKSMLIWRTQGLCEELCRWKYPHADKRTVNATLHNISKVELLLLTPNCPTCLGDTRMSSRDTKNLHPLFCIIRRRGGAGVTGSLPVSPSHFVYHSNDNLVPLSMRDQE